MGCVHHLADQSVAVLIDKDDVAAMHATLWHGNDKDQDGEGAVTHTLDRSGEPSFAGDGHHMQQGSAAQDSGVGAGVVTDIDGDERPTGAGYDSGADEFAILNKFIYLPLTMK